MISLRDIHKAFGPIKAVRGVSFDLPEGQVAGLLGPNGAGKSTTIRVLTGFFRPDSGRATLAGIDVLKSPRKARRLLGYLPESAPHHAEMRTIDTLRFRGRLYGLSGRDLRKACDRVIGLCALEPVRTRRVGQLSKGYKQRVGLAAALVHDPPVVVLDEPTNGLDPTQIRSARSLIRELGESKTVLVSSHMLAEVEKTCDRVVIVASGQVKADGKPAELVKDAAAGAIRAICLGARAAIDQALKPIGQIEFTDDPSSPEGPHVLTLNPLNSAPIDPNDAARALVAAGAKVVEIAPATRSLEDVFVRCVEEARA